MKTLAAFSAVILLCVAPLAHATDVHVSCIPSTTWTTQVAMTPAEIATSRFSLFGGLSGQPKQKLVIENDAVCDSIRRNVAAGVQEYYWTQTTSGLESAPSVTVSKTVSATPVVDTDSDGVPDTSDACPTLKGPAPTGCPAPTPPTGVTATTQTAYEYRPSTQVMAAIGLIPEGVPCGPEEMLWKSVVYCRVKLADSLPVVWPTNRSLREVWAVKPAG